MKSNVKILSALLVLMFLQMTLASVTVIKLPPAHAQEQIIYDPNAELRLAFYYMTSLNPLTTQTAYDWEILDWLFDPFTVYNPFNYTNPDADIPLLAAEPPKFEIVQDHELGEIGVWTIKIRDNVYFFDGEKLTVEDVKFTYDFLKWCLEAQVTPFTFTEEAAAVINATIVDNTTIKVYTYYTGYIYRLFAIGIIVFPKHIYGDENTWGLHDADDYDYFPNWNLTGDYISNYYVKGPNDPILTGYGPFYVKEWEPGKNVSTTTYIILERNPNYYLRALDEQGNEIVKWRPITEEYIDPHGPYIKRLVYKVIEEPIDELRALYNGEIDMIQGAWFGRAIRELTEKGYTVDTATPLSFGHIAFQCSSEKVGGLLKNPAFRRAIAFAVDKRRYIYDIMLGFGIPTDSPVVPGFGDWSIEVRKEQKPGPDYYDANPQEARRILEEEVGLKDIDDDGFYELDPNDPESDVTLEIALTQTALLEQIGQIFEESIEAAGIRVELNFMDWNSLIYYWISGEFEATYFGWLMGRLPTILIVWTSDYRWNLYIYRWRNDTYDFYVESMLNATTIDEAMQWAWKAQQILYWEQPFVTIAEPVTVGAYNATQWAGIVKTPVSPVITYWTIMHCVKVVKRAAPPPAPVIPVEYIIGGAVIAVIIIVVAVLLLRRKPAA